MESFHEVTSATWVGNSAGLTVFKQFSRALEVLRHGPLNPLSIIDTFCFLKEISFDKWDPKPNNNGLLLDPSNQHFTDG